MVISYKRMMSVVVLLLAVLMQGAIAKNKKACCCKKVCPRGADLTKLDLTPVNIIVPKNYPDNGDKINLVAKYASKDTGGRDVLFIHGNPFCHIQWKNQLAAPCLRNKHNLYVLDCRGYGESDKPNPSAPPQPSPPPFPPDAQDTVYRPWQNYANDIHQTIEQLGLHKPVLVGHSLSAVYINDYLRMFGDSKLGGLVLLAGLPDPFNSVPSLTQWINPELLAFAASTGFLTTPDLEVAIPGAQFALSAFIFSGGPCKIDQVDREEVIYYVALIPPIVRAGILNHDGVPPVGNGMPLPSNDDIWQMVTVPTKSIIGANDQDVTRAAAEHLATVIPTAQLSIIKNAGHFLQLQASKKFNKELLAFLDSL